ncbi:MAG: VacB/RNase II family 3'-5' exoribonuclease [Coriobacteriales bacterium]|jgi:ribonuclease R|nr:VacB/RNase II family 3'-5' exoribonuclease [Coriobacteriales bacterium]
MSRRNRKGRRRRTETSTGVIRVARKGHGFVDTPEGEFLVLRRHLRGAMDGDTVEVARLRALEARRRTQRRRAGAAPQGQGGQGAGADGGERREMLGSVQRVTRRAHTTLVGTLRCADGLAVVRPLDERVPYDLFVDRRVPAPDGPVARAEDGDVVVVRITVYPTRLEAAQGVIEEVLGKEDDGGAAIEAVIHRYGFERGFSAAALEEAEGLASFEDPPPLPRHDLRGRLVFTIDPEDAKDFDDALSLDVADGQLRLGVHIADVSSYVAWDSALDLDARRRSTSVYLPDRVIPMLPLPLSEGLCSLAPGTDRRAFTVDMAVDGEGNVTGTRFYPSLVRSAVRLTYDEAQRMLGEEPAEGDALGRRLHALHRLAEAFERRRLQRGAIGFEGVEAKLALDGEGVPLGVRLRTKTAATSLVEECMIRANEEVAAFMLRGRAPMLYRVHEEPYASALEALVPTLREFGYAQGGAPQTSRQVQEILEASAGRPEHHLVSSLLLRAMKRARYAPAFTEHFGLASTAYTHFTSPIRRYPDLMAHRLLKCRLAGRPPSADMAAQLDWICRYSSERERDAEQASREATACKLCEYLGPRTGERFRGVVVAVGAAGVTVREETTTAEGLIERDALPAGLELDMAHQRYRDPVNGRAVRLGQPVEVVLLSVDRPRSRLVFVLR